MFSIYYHYIILLKFIIFKTKIKNSGYLNEYICYLYLTCISYIVIIVGIQFVDYIFNLMLSNY